MSTAQETKRPPMTEEEAKKFINDTTKLIENALVAGRMLHMMARNSGMGELEIALGMQIATVYILGKDPLLAAAYQGLLEPLYKIARMVGVPGYKAAQPDPSIPAPENKLADDEFEIEKIQVVHSQFKMGDVRLSKAVQEVLGPNRLISCLMLYSEKNWGDFLSEEEKARNDENSKKDEGTIFAIYLIDPDKEREPENTFYVITKPDRSGTDILMASEY